jgi:hypothetical protein
MTNTTQLTNEMNLPMHLVLLGDSIFDNALYVPGQSAVIDHVRHCMPVDWTATLVAVDGDFVANVAGQLERIPTGATHLVISVGGNDALRASTVVSLPAKTVNEALTYLDELRRDFRQSYRAMLWQAIARELPVAVCTIYDAVPGLAKELQTALCLFNDSIVREAHAVGVPIIDIRHICTEATDYSTVSPIEPSGEGGRKIATALVRFHESAMLRPSLQLS